MFYPVDSLRKGGRFHLCWIADSWPLRFEQYTHRNQRLWSQDIREICDHLRQVMNEESGRPTRRFSLRLSSQLLRGLARLYQKKVEVFVRDVVNISIKVRNPKTSVLERTAAPRKRPRTSATVASARPATYIVELPADEVNLEQIQENAQNMIARVEDITMTEPNLQEMRLIDDGFGELNRDPVEIMLAHEVSMMQQSAVDLPLEVSAEKSHDKSRLAPHDAAQLERISEHDVSLFGKSAVEAPTLTDFEKEIPDISEIPPPVLPAPEPQKQLIEEPQVEELPRDQRATEPAQQNEPQEIVLEELEDELPRKRQRRLRNELIIDEIKKLSTSCMRQRTADHTVELRCRTVQDDVINVNPRVHVDTLLSRPASKFSNALGALFGRLLARDLGRPPVADRHVEEVLSRSPVNQQPMEEIIAAEPSVANQTIQEMTVPVMQDISNIDRSARAALEVADISDLPTQKLSTVSQEERADRPGETQKRTCSQRRSSLHITAAEADKENVPGAANIQEPGIPAIILSTDEAAQQADIEHIASRLQRAGLVEQQRKPPSIEPTLTESRRIRDSEGSETPLGSLDRTKVSLGDSEKITDAKKFLDEQWGVEGTMYKIFRCFHKGVTPITVELLVRRGPVMPSRQRIVAARCFTSILKLQTHGFIKVTKDEETNAIKNIELVPRFNKH